MSSEILSGPPAPRPPFRLAVLGTADWADAGTVDRLIRQLVARVFGTHRITLVLAGTLRGQSPIVTLDDWRFELIPSFGGAFRQDRELSEWCDAALILGPAAPWRNLLRLFEKAEKPARVHTHRPKLRAATADPLDGL